VVRTKRKPGNPLEDGNCICGFTPQCFLINPDKRPAGYVAQQWKLDKVNEDWSTHAHRSRNWPSHSTPGHTEAYDGGYSFLNCNYSYTYSANTTASG
jgi:hypothetical protein